MPFQFFQRPGCHKSRFSDSLNGQRWRFLRSNVDDFRQGFLPSCEGIIIQPARGSGPLLHSRKPKNLVKASQRSREMLTEPQSYTSKLSLMSRTRKNHVAEVEYCLSQHPSALHPHLQESIPAEDQWSRPQLTHGKKKKESAGGSRGSSLLHSQISSEKGVLSPRTRPQQTSQTNLFKEVLSILDPDVLPSSQEPEANLDGEPCLPSTIPPHQGNKQARAKRVNCKDPEDKSPYTWFSSTEVAARELEARLNYVPPLDENIKRVTKDLCNGFNALGGEKYNIDEDTILSMFGADYKTKFPILPIYVELHDLPMDLRKHVGMLPFQAIRKNPDPDAHSSKDPCQSRWEKIRYGAWYLDPKTWKKQKVSETLENPKAKDNKLKNSRRLLNEEDANFMQLHGTHAFREFLERKGYRIPEFLQEVLEEQKSVGPKTRVLKNPKNESQRCKEPREDYLSGMGN